MACLLVAMLLPVQTLAQEGAPSQEEAQVRDRLPAPAQDETPPSAKEERQGPVRQEFLDVPHDFLSRRVEEFSRRLDSFFGDPNRAYDSTGSTVQIRGHVTYFEGGHTEGRSEVRANVSLPNTEDRLRLVIQRGVEAATQTEVERRIKDVTGSSQVTAPGAQPDNNYYLGLKALAAEALGVKMSAEAGAKFRWPLDPYVRLRAFRDFAFSGWLIRVSETPLWKESEGASAATELSFDRLLGEKWQLRLISKATWRATTDYFDLAQIGALYFAPDRRTVYTFELGAFAPSDPSANQSAYSVTLRMRRQIYRDWLFLELAPQVLYQEANAFRATRSLMVQVETLLGDRYLKP